LADQSFDEGRRGGDPVDDRHGQAIPHVLFEAGHARAAEADDFGPFRDCSLSGRHDRFSRGTMCRS
jgi:hypothetical protein